MLHSRFLIVFAFFGVASASAQTAPNSSLENRGNIGLNTHDSSGKPKTKLTKSDSQFVRETMESGRRENDKSRLALSHASDPRVKDLAKVLMDDHSAESNQLTALATKSGFSDFMAITKDYFSARFT